MSVSILALNLLRNIVDNILSGHRLLTSLRIDARHFPCLVSPTFLTVRPRFNHFVPEETEFNEASVSAGMELAYV